MKKPPARRRYSQVLAATLLTAMLAATPSAQAATTYTWNTTTSGALWSAPGSWTPASVPTFVAGDTVDLSTLNIGAGTTSTMDTVGGNTLGTVKIGDTNNTHSWALSLSTALTLDGNGSAAAINQVAQSKGDTINGAGGIVVASDLNITNASGNILQVSTGITATGATRMITNNGGGFGRVNLNSAIGAGINLVQNSTSSATWMLAASGSFNGTITVKAGNFEVGATGANGIGLGSAAFTLGDTTGSSDATLVFKSGNGSGYAAPITVASGSTGTKSIIGAVTSGNNSYFLNGAITLGPDSTHTADVTIGNSTNSTSTYSVNGGITGFGNVTVKTTNTGKTRFATTSINNTGTLTNAGTSSGAAQIDVAVGANVTGVVQNSSTSQMNLNAANTNFAGSVTVSAGTLAATNTTALNSNNAVAVASGATFSLQAATLTIAGLNDSTTAGTVSTTGVNTLTLGGSGTYSFSGVIQNGTGTLAVTKSGAGTQKLSGANTYTGKTTVSGGTLQFAKETSLYNNTTASWTAANINVASGATLALNVGGSGEFTSSDLNTLLTNISAVTSNGLLSGAKIALDTTNAGGSFTQGNAIANSTGTGGGAIGLTKLGTGSLVMDQTNTYTGATLISAGTLQLGSGGTTGSLSTSSTITNNGTLAFNRSNAVAQGTDFATVIGGSGSVSQIGSGTVTLSGANTYTGGTTISAGTLALGSSTTLQSATGDITVTGGTLSSSVASTTLGGNLTVSGGSLAANGASAGTIILAANRTFAMSTGTLTYSLNDSITGSGTGTFGITGGTFDLTNSITDYSIGYSVFIGFASGSVAGLTFVNYDNANYIASLSNLGQLTFTPIPEPSTCAALVGALALGAVALRRRRKVLQA